MKVFMSWSGPRSHAVAQLLGDWLQDVIQAVKPWISSAGIDRGEQWFRKIGDNLGEVNIGIVCLTPENKENPWIMFEAGALLKGLPDARVITFLIDLKHQDVREPLSQFNHTTPSKTDMMSLVTTLNSRLKEAALTEARLLSVFNTFWPQFESKFDAIMLKHKPEVKVEERPQGEILSEVLETVRGLKQQLRPVMPPMDIGLGKGGLFVGGPIKTSKRIVEQHVIQGFKEGLSLQTIIDSAPAAGFTARGSMLDFMTSIYETIHNDPRLAGIERPSFDTGDERQ